MKLRNSLTYEPVELGFGTSGLRGLVVDMTDLECYINTLGFLDFLQRAGYQEGSQVLLAGDLRTSTPRIMQAVTQAILDKGYIPLNCGLVPTPTVALYAYQQNKPCVMVTGSHIPADRNGIKYYKQSGEVLKSDEASIKSCVAEVRETIYDSEVETSAFTADGSLNNPPALPNVDSQATANYKQRYADFFVADGLAGKKVIVYQHSAVGRDILADILSAHGAEVIAVDRSDTFIPIDTENVTEADKALFVSYAEAHPDVFAIVSTDGDSDRPFVIDESGTFYRGDILGCVVADYLGAQFAALPISSNDAADEFLKDKGIEAVHTRIGSPYVIVAMEQAKVDACVGWEVNGGFLIGSKIIKNDKILEPLPTRDAVLPILCALYTAAEANTTVSQLFKRLPQRFTGGGLLDNVPLEKIRAFLQVCEDMSKTEALMKTIFAGSDLGDVVKLDLTDGLRVRLASGNVIHFRPSGNAPQFRVYTNANSQDEADTLVERSLASTGFIQKILENV